MKCSTIIINWNTRDYLIACISSLKRFSIQGDNQIIVVDNASKDGSVEILARAHPEVEILAATENLGFAKANNMGIRAAAGKYVCLVNSDIELIESVLEKMRDYMDANPDIGLLAPRLLNSDRISIQQGCWHFPTPMRTIAFSLGLTHFFPKVALFAVEANQAGLSPREVDTACGAFWMIRRETLENVGLLDETFWFYGEDVDWCRRCREAGWRVVYYPEAKVVHFGGASSSKTPSRYRVQQTNARLQIWKKYYCKPIYGLLWLAKAGEHALRAVCYYVKSRRQVPETNALVSLRHHLACLRWMLGGKTSE